MQDILNCGSTIQNITDFDCEARLGLINAVLLSLVKTELTFSNALLEASYTTEINKARAERLFVLQEADDVTRNQEDPVFYDGNVSKRKLIRKGRLDLAFEYHDQQDCVCNAYKTFNGARMYALFLTENGAIIGGDDGTNFLGVPIDVFVSEPIPPETKDDPWRLIVWVYLVNTEGNFTKAILPNDSDYNNGTPWDPASLEGIIDIEFEEVSSSGTEIVVKAYGKCDGREITGLIDDDFDVDGSTGVTDDGNEYTIAGTFSGTVDVGLVNQPGMTTKGIECPTPLSVTI